MCIIMTSKQYTSVPLMIIILSIMYSKVYTRWLLLKLSLISTAYLTKIILNSFYKHVRFIHLNVMHYDLIGIIMFLNGRTCTYVHININHH